MSGAVAAQHDLVAVPRVDLENLAAKAHRRFLSITSAAQWTDLSQESIRRLLASGKLQAHRPVRGKVLVDRVELESLVLSATSAPRKGRGRGSP